MAVRGGFFRLAVAVLAATLDALAHISLHELLNEFLVSTVVVVEDNR